MLKKQKKNKHLGCWKKSREATEEDKVKDSIKKWSFFFEDEVRLEGLGQGCVFTLGEGEGGGGQQSQLPLHLNILKKIKVFKEKHYRNVFRWRKVEEAGVCVATIKESPPPSVVSERLR